MAKEAANIKADLDSRIDVPGTLFAYGTLLDTKVLGEHIVQESHNGNAVIHEVNDLDQAVRLREQDPNCIVIAKGIQLDGIHASVVSEERMRVLWEELGNQRQTFLDQMHTDGIIPDATEAEFEKVKDNTYLVLTKKETNGRSVNGGLILGLTEEDLQVIDNYEFASPDKTDTGRTIYTRQNLDTLRQDDTELSAQNVEFYGGSPEIQEWNTASSLGAVMKAVRSTGRDILKWPKKVR